MSSIMTERNDEAMTTTGYERVFRGGLTGRNDLTFCEGDVARFSDRDDEFLTERGWVMTI